MGVNWGDGKISKSLIKITSVLCLCLSLNVPFDSRLWRDCVTGRGDPPWPLPRAQALEPDMPGF